MDGRAADAQHVRVEIGFDGNVGSMREEPGEFRGLPAFQEDLVQAHDFPALDAAPCQRQKVLNDGRRPLSGFENFRGLGFCRTGLIQIVKQQLRKTYHHTEHVVKVVGDSSRQGAQSFHFFRALQPFLQSGALLLRLPALGHVKRKTASTQDFSAGSENGTLKCMKPLGGAPVENGLLQGNGDAFRHDPPVVCPVSFGKLPRPDVQVGLSRHLFRCLPAAGPGKGMVYGKVPAVCVLEPEQAGLIFDYGRQVGFPQVQRFGRLPALRDILIYSEDSQNLSVGKPQRDFTGIEPYSGTRWRGLRLHNIHFRDAGLNHAEVIRAVEFGLFLPAHRKVVLTQKLPRVAQTRIPGKMGITAQEAQVPVLPENPDGDRFDDQLQHIHGVFETLGGYKQFRVLSR